MEDYGKFQDKGVKGKDPSKVSPNAKITGQQAPNAPYRFGSGSQRGTFKSFVKRMSIFAKQKNIRFRQNKIVNGKKVSKIYYFLENLELDVIMSIKRVVGYQENLEYELMLIDDDDIDDIKHEFDTIQIINHDKA